MKKRVSLSKITPTVANFLHGNCQSVSSPRCWSFWRMACSPDAQAARTGFRRFVSPMSQEEILAAARAHVRERLESDSSGHDWWHIDRVVRLARRLAHYA